MGMGENKGKKITKEEIDALGIGEACDRCGLVYAICYKEL